LDGRTRSCGIGRATLFLTVYRFGLSIGPLGYKVVFGITMPLMQIIVLGWRLKIRALPTEFFP
jgi:hypothetical protein